MTEKVVAKRKKRHRQEDQTKVGVAGVEASGNVVSHGEFVQITRDGIGEHRCKHDGLKSNARFERRMTIVFP